MSRPGYATAPELQPSPPTQREDAAGAEEKVAAGWEDEPSSGVVLRGAGPTSIPRLGVSIAELMALPLDHRAGFMASFVDGTFTLEMILDACALPRDEALALLADLAARGVIVF